MRLLPLTKGRQDRRAKRSQTCRPLTLTKKRSKKTTTSEGHGVLTLLPRVPSHFTETFISVKHIFTICESNELESL